MALDPRLNAFRPDLADQRLKSVVDSERFSAGKLYQVDAPVAGIHAEPRSDAQLVSQALFGERVQVFDVRQGWAWGQCKSDSYVGYLPLDALSHHVTAATHRVRVLASYLYVQPGIKTQPVEPVYLNSELSVVSADGDFAELADGRFVWASHICPIAERESDPAEVAARFEHVPYLWGGKTQAGLDCSGLVQASFAAAGRPCPRDSDMMEQSIGEALMINDLEALQRGDLVFWKGHVGMMLDTVHLVHANGYHMMTVIEPLVDAVTRIGGLFGTVTGLRRP